MSDHSSDSYQPSESGDHSKMWILMGDGSDRRVAIAGIETVSGREERNADTLLKSPVVVSGRGAASSLGRGGEWALVEGGRWGARDLINVSDVWSGSSGSHVSIQDVVGVKSAWFARRDDEPLRFGLAVLVWRVNDGVPAGSFPRAFSDMPRSWTGTLSSADEEMEGVRELRNDGEDCAGVG